MRLKKNEDRQVMTDKFAIGICGGKQTDLKKREESRKINVCSGVGACLKVSTYNLSILVITKAARGHKKSTGISNHSAFLPSLSQRLFYISPAYQCMHIWRTTFILTPAFRP